MKIATGMQWPDFWMTTQSGDVMRYSGGSFPKEDNIRWRILDSISAAGRLKNEYFLSKFNHGKGVRSLFVLSIPGKPLLIAIWAIPYSVMKFLEIPDNNSPSAISVNMFPNPWIIPPRRFGACKNHENHVSSPAGKVTPKYVTKTPDIPDNSPCGLVAPDNG